MHVFICIASFLLCFAGSANLVQWQGPHCLLITIRKVHSESEASLVRCTSLVSAMTNTLNLLHVCHLIEEVRRLHHSSINLKPCSPSQCEVWDNSSGRSTKMAIWTAEDEESFCLTILMIKTFDPLSLVNEIIAQRCVNLLCYISYLVSILKLIPV